MASVTGVSVEEGGESAADDGVPRIPASASALVWDRRGRLLILNPTYKGGWSLPGGMVEADGETPWEACRREAAEECGLALRRGKLVCVDFLRPRPGRPGGMRFLFDGGTFTDEALAGIVLEEAEISEHRMVRIKTALRLLSGPVGRRVAAVVDKPGRLRYLEDGRPMR